jgi:hypothetical protein
VPPVAGSLACAYSIRCRVLPARKVPDTDRLVRNGDAPLLPIGRERIIGRHKREALDAGASVATRAQACRGQAQTRPRWSASLVGADVIVSRTEVGDGPNIGNRAGPRARTYPPLFCCLWLLPLVRPHGRVDPAERLKEAGACMAETRWRFAPGRRPSLAHRVEVVQVAKEFVEAV